MTLRTNRRVDGFTEALLEIGYQGIRRGDLVIHSMDAFAGAIGVSDSDGKSSPVVHAYVGTRGDPRFLAYCVRTAARSGYIESLAKGIRERSTAFDAPMFKYMLLPAPPIHEQVAIADFLDRETARIDELMDKQQSLVHRVQSRESSVISQVVGSEALAAPGPRLKHFVIGIRQGWSPQCNNWPAEADEWAVLKVGCVNGGRFRASENKQLPHDVDPRPETVVQAGELLVSRANTRELVGSAAVADGEHPRLMLSDKVYAMRLRQEANADFVSLALRTRRFRDLIELEATGASSSMQNISQGILLNLPMNLPGREAQDEAVARLSQVLEASIGLITQSERFMALALERRAALIAAAVTGQLNVGKAA